MAWLGAHPYDSGFLLLRMTTPRIGASPRRSKVAEETLRVLNAFAVSLLKQNRLDDLLWNIAENIGLLLGFEDSVIYLSKSGTLHQYAAFGIKNPTKREIQNPMLIQVGQGVVGRVAETAQSLLISDTGECDFYLRDDFPGRSEISVPVIYHGEVLAVIDAEATVVDAFDYADLEILTSIANIAAPRIASALHEEERRNVGKELRFAKEELEERVEQRTSLLASSIRELEDEIQKNRRVERALETERHLLHLTLHAIGDGLFATDANGGIVLASDAALRMTGSTREKARGRPLAEVYRTFETTDDGTTRGRPSVSPSVADTTCSRSSTKLLPSDDGEMRTLDEVVSPIRDAEGITIGIVVTFRDVTLERALERQAQKTQRMESLGVLAGGVAHDFNNVLTGILGRINLAQTCEGDLLSVSNALRDAEDGCLTARGLTKELLTFAKGGTPVKNVGSIGDLILDSMRFCLHGSPVDTRLELDDGLFTIEMDSVQITQVLNNLILNAVQAMPDGGELLIRAHNERPAECAERKSNGLADAEAVVVTIHDAGGGIPENAADRIFDPYFTTKNAHSGLGLATSYWIIQRHGGHLRLLETSSRGSTFEIRLPASTVLGPIAPAPPPNTGGLSPRLNVLLMDDEPSVRTTVAAMLKRIGHAVATASKGEDAIELYVEAKESSQPFDVTLLDLTVRGGLGGLKTLERLRALEPDLKAVVVSGYSDDPVLANHREHGFDDRLEKPFTLNQLRDVLTSLARDRG